MCLYVLACVTLSCPTLCDPMDCSLQASSVHGLLQARILEWVAMPFSRGSSWPRFRTQVYGIAGRFFPVWATREAHIAYQTLEMCLRILKWGEYPITFTWDWFNHTGPCKTERSKSENVRGQTQVRAMNLEMEEDATNQGIQAASSSWKEQGSRFSPVLRMNVALPINWF